MKDPEALESEVARIVSRILRVDVGADASRLNVPGWDSLRHVEILFAIEEAYGVTLDEAEMAALDSVKRLAKRVGTPR